jgi:NAD(P) transhydrogenase subunit beta
MAESFIPLVYLLSGVLFILCLAGLSAQESARRGSVFGIVGMILAIGVTMWPSLVAPAAYPALIGAAVVGGLIGAVMGARVAMTAMPEMVALLHSFVGIAAVLVGLSQVLAIDPHAEHDIAHIVHSFELFIDVLIGAITFTGSIVAFLKLRGTWGGKPLRLPGRHVINLGALVLMIGLGIHFSVTGSPIGLWVTLVLASGLGVTLIGAIGGADMPVAVSLLNSYSGWTAAAAGFVLGNDLLIITGALVGSSGAILSYIMCKAMNRSILNVIFGDIAATSGAGGPAKAMDPALLEAMERGVNTAEPDEAADVMRSVSEIVIVPGYGMAVAQAQNAVRELTNLLEEGGARVRFAIHPVAGRLPGHMNVLLAEANVPYDQVLEMEDINDDFQTTPVVLVVGANDIVNPSALDDPASPLYGMPTLEVHKAQTVYVIKRSLRPGYSGVDNPLYFLDNTIMVFGDAKAVIEGLVKSLKAA